MVVDLLFTLSTYNTGGKCEPQGIRRINLGGLQMISYLHRLLQLKYPSHLSSATFTRAEVFDSELECRIPFNFI